MTTLSAKPTSGPGSRLKPLACPHCDEGHQGQTLPKESPANDHPEARTLRRYVCKNCGHKYNTVEALATAGLDRLRIVGRDGDTRHSVHAYNRALLAADLDAILVKGLTEGERRMLVTVIEHRIERVADRKRRDQRLSAEDDVTLGVDELVEAALAGFVDATHRSWHGHRDGLDRVRVAHAQYALATLAAGPAGKWKSALPFIEWLEANYPVLHQRRPSKGLEPIVTWADWVWVRPAGELPTQIVQVVKNTRHSGDDPPRRPRRDFDETKVRSKIARALLGRDTKGILANKIYEYVMWALAGQVVVRTSQISSAIASTLRMVDPIGYLRWVTIGKELSLNQLYDEAVHLVTVPSPKLILRLSPQPMPQYVGGLTEAETR